MYQLKSINKHPLTCHNKVKCHSRSRTVGRFVKYPFPQDNQNVKLGGHGNGGGDDDDDDEEEDGEAADMEGTSEFLRFVGRCSVFFLLRYP